MRNSGTAELTAGAARGTFGDYLKGLRTGLGLTLSAASERAGMSLAAYRNIEMGARSSIGPGELKQLAEAFGEKPAVMMQKALEAGY